MRRFALVLLFFLGLGLLTAGRSSAPAIESPLTVTLEAGTEREQATRDQLLRLLDEHDVDRWIFTERVHIDETDLPHSHPVLTLHARHLGDDPMLLSTFVHEQFHWRVADDAANEEAAIEAFREVFPDAPGREGGGARDPYSSYLHLIVCDLEFQAMTVVYGEEAARELLGRITHYTWIYERVLGDPRVRRINERFGFVAP